MIKSKHIYMKNTQYSIVTFPSKIFTNSNSQIYSSYAFRFVYISNTYVNTNHTISRVKKNKVKLRRNVCLIEILN